MMILKTEKLTKLAGKRKIAIRNCCSARLSFVFLVYDVCLLHNQRQAHRIRFRIKLCRWCRMAANFTCFVLLFFAVTVCECHIETQCYLLTYLLTYAYKYCYITTSVKMT